MTFSLTSLNLSQSKRMMTRCWIIFVLLYVGSGRVYIPFCQTCWPCYVKLCWKGGREEDDNSCFLFSRAFYKRRWTPLPLYASVASCASVNGHRICSSELGWRNNRSSPHLPHLITHWIDKSLPGEGNPWSPPCGRGGWQWLWCWWKYHFFYMTVKIASNKNDDLRA